MLIIYQSCQDELPNSNEVPVREHWAEQHPSKGDTVAMGGDRQWSIVRVIEFKAIADFYLVPSVFLAYVSPVGVPLTGQWSCDQMKDFYPRQSLEVALFQKGQPSLEISYSMEGLPLAGTLFSEERTEHPTLMRSLVRPWMVRLVERYEPSVADSAFCAIHLCWCVPMPQMEAISVAS
jgi:hypothetical protein